MRIAARDRIVERAVSLYAREYDRRVALMTSVVRDVWIPANASVTDAKEGLTEAQILKRLGGLPPFDARREFRQVAELLDTHGREALYDLGIPKLRLDQLVPLGQIEGFAESNARLIKGLDALAQKQVKEFFASGPRGTARELAKRVQEQFDIGRSRAMFWARDQTLKLHGQITESRHAELGITHYVWGTSGDERVRETHIALDGVQIPWSDPPDVGHPGQDYQCRCFAYPII